MALDEKYDFQGIERRWQAHWRETDLYHVEMDPDRPKYYGLEMFPYPSGAGLSVGHFKNYAPNDAFLRYKAMRGFNVLHPMGWDAFGLPAENEAIKRQRQPAEMVAAYAANYKRQLDLIGMGYDWDREINSSDPDYYKWTQWLFLLLYRRGLAERKNAPINWCPFDKTALANEEVVNGRCQRCDTPVEKRQMPQWFFKITAYAERLLHDLDTLDWSEGIKAMQRNWIGRSEGAHVDFPLHPLAPDTPPAPDHGGITSGASQAPPLSGAGGVSGAGGMSGAGGAIRVFTTRPDTLWGATFMVLAPEHPLVPQITTPEQLDAVDAYRTRAERETEIERQAEGREKTGVWTGAYAVNPVNDETIPVWISDYVLMGYGTGAIMAVPAHDQRDFEFARKFGLTVVPVYQEPGQTIEGPELTAATTDRGVLVHSGPFNGLAYSKETVGKVAAWLKGRGIGEPIVTYKLRDWLISRQRYWGAPIPIIHCGRCGEVPVPEDQLPVKLPDVANYQPSGTGESPLATIPEFVDTTCPTCGGLARRETDTMGGFACSSWYFLRFADPHNAEEAFSREAVDYWLPVDTYAGGAEHAVMHLLYARFWTKALYDAGLVGFVEPFNTLRNQGMMLAWTPGRRPAPGEDAGGEEVDEPVDDWKVVKPEERADYPPDELIWRWAKMSKSKGNVVTPDEMAAQYGADALRLYEMFVAPFEETVQWNEEGIRGAAKFLARVYRLVAFHGPGINDGCWDTRLDGLSDRDRALRRKTHQSIARVADDLEHFRFNTAVAGLMEWTNAMYEVANALPAGTRSAALDEAVSLFVPVLAPFAPHLADELWTAGLGRAGFLYRHPWPVPDADAARNEEITLIVQINGKVRDKLTAPAGATNAELEAFALASSRVREQMNGGVPRKVIVVPGKLVNVVI